MYWYSNIYYIFTNLGRMGNYMGYNWISSELMNIYIYIYSQQCDNARYAMEYITKKMPFALCFQIGASPIGNTHTYLLHSGGHDDPTAPAVGLYRA